MIFNTLMGTLEKNLVLTHRDPQNVAISDKVESEGDFS